MTLKFDKYYSLDAGERLRARRRILPPASSVSYSEESEDMDAATTPTMSDLGNRWNPRTREWTLWTLRDPLLESASALRATSSNGVERIWCRESKVNFLQSIFLSARRLCTEFAAIPLSAIVMRSRCGRAYRADNILTYGETFAYSFLSDTVTIDVSEVGFEVDGQRDNQRALGRVKLRACGGLAQILASCIKSDDMFIIVGRDVEVKREGSEVNLNFIRDPEQDSQPLVLIRLAFDLSCQNVSLMEKINHHKVAGYYDFKYSCFDRGSGYSVSFNRFRTFSIKEGHERGNGYADVPVPIDASDNFAMPITREAILVHIYSHILAPQNGNQIRGFELVRNRDSVSSGASTFSPECAKTPSSYKSTTSSSPASSRELSPFDPSHRNFRGQRSRRTSRRYSEDEDEDEGYRTSSERSKVKSGDSLGILLLKAFCVIGPIITVVIFALLFKPGPPPCFHQHGGGVPPEAPPPATEYAAYNTFNYEDI